MSYSKIPKSLPSKETDDYKENFRTTIRAVGGEWFIEKMNKQGQEGNFGQKYRSE